MPTRRPHISALARAFPLTVAAVCLRAQMKRSRNHEEHDLQKECVNWLRANDYLVVAVANDVVLSGKTPQHRARQMASLKAMGLHVGFPDLFVLRMGTSARSLHGLRIEAQPGLPACGGLGVELKVRGRPLTRLQEKCRDDMRARGYAYVTVGSLEQLQYFLKFHISGASGAAEDPVPCA